MENSHNDTAVALQAILVNFLWGTPIIFIKKGYEAFGITDVGSEILFAGIRFASAGLILLLIGTFRDGKLPMVRKENRLPTLVLGLVHIGLTYFFFYIGTGNTSGTNGTIINAFSPFGVLLFSLLFFRSERISAKLLIALLMGFCGILISLIEPGQGIVAKLNGEGFILISIMVFCFGSIFSKRIAKTDNYYTITAWDLFIGGIALLIVALALGGKFERFSVKGLLILCYLTFVAGFAVLLWSKLLAENPANKVCIYQFVNPLTGTILSALMLGENIFKAKYLIALLLVCGGIILVNMKKDC